MIDNFLKIAREAFDFVDPLWLILGGLVAIFLIILVGFIMTIITARAVLDECNAAHVVRSRSRRNAIFFIAFTFSAVATLVIFYMFSGITKTATLYLIIPVAVLLWAFLCEAIFEAIDARNRKKSGIKICYCTCCDDCTVSPAKSKKEARETDYKATFREEKRQDKTETKEAKREAKHIEARFNKESRIDSEVQEKKKSAVEDAKHETKTDRRGIEEKLQAMEDRRSEISRQLAQAEKRERERVEAEKSREEVREIKAATDAEGDTLRRIKFEEERRQLAILARDAKAAQFGSDSRLPERPAPRPLQTVPVAKPITQEAVAKPAPVVSAKPVIVESVKPAIIARTTDDIDTRKESSETTITKTATSSRVSNIVTSDSSGSKVNAKFESLQAKLDILKKDNEAARITAVKTEVRGKYDEGEVKNALGDLIKSMNARRKDSE